MSSGSTLNIAALALAISCWMSPTRADSPAELAASFDKQVMPLLQRYCYECHGNGKHKSDLALDSFKTIADIDKHHDTWELVLDNVRKVDMPPEDAKAIPTAAEREIITGWLERKLYNFDPKNPDPGRVTIHRLNRAEYNNTIRDLVGVNFQPAEDFPSDDSGYGFDNIGDVLSLPPVLMEKYLAAANRIIDAAIVTEPFKRQTRRFKANLMEMGFNADGDRGDGWMPLSGLEEDGLATVLDVNAGDYIVRVQAFARGRGSGGPLKLSCMLDNAVIGDMDVTATEQNPGIYEIRLGVPAGRHRFKVLNKRLRGGANELLMKNGRLGKEQGGVVWVKWVEIDGPLPGATRRFPAAQLQAAGEVKALPDGGLLLGHGGELTATFTVTADGDYLLRAQAYADQAGDEPARMQWRINGAVIKDIDVTAPATLVPIQGQRPFSSELLKPMPQVYELPAHLKAGENRFAAAFINDFVDPSATNPNLRRRALYIDHLEIVSLSEAQPLPPMPAPLRQLFAGVQPAPADKTAAARNIIGEFAHRAWRRLVTTAEIDGLTGLFALADQNGEKFEAALKLPMKAILVSPYFLFRGELQPEPDDPKSVHSVSEYSLASRLSYFIWSSTPDDELLALAESGTLRKHLEAQVRRMLASPKSHALVENFAGQWLQIRNLKFVAPDKTLFPSFDEDLRQAMATETQLFFESILREDRGIVDFLNADYTFVNERLARHYGIPNIKGDQFQKVSLVGTARRGVLTQASVLTITSNPTRTSPVKRGKWVLENILGTPPPPPPPDVPELKNDGKPETGSLRAQMEQHRANPSCASCHARMDPLGFGLENFDAIGKLREKDGAFPVDTSGQLVTGETFHGPTDLSGILATKKRENFVRCLSEKMLTYGLGRGLEYYDHPAVDKIVQGVNQNNGKFSSLIVEVVNSLPFQMRRGDGMQAAAR